jgi:CHAT domain-containing protein/tetratricopeptide (TPR) repeat protein
MIRVFSWLLVLAGLGFGPRLQAEAPAPPQFTEFLYSCRASTPRHTGQRLTLGETALSAQVEQPSYFEVDVPAGSFLKLTVDQRELDFKVCLFGPDGRLALALDSPFGTRRPEELFWPVATTGRHVIQVESFARFFGEPRLVLHYALVKTPSARDRMAARATEVTALADEIRRTKRSPELALPLLDEAIELWRRLGNRPRSDAARLSRLRVAALAEGEDVLAALESAVPWLEKAGEDELLGWLWIELARERERPESSRQLLFQSALAVHEKLGNLREQAIVHNELGQIADDRGRFQLATEHFDAAIRLAERCGEPAELANALLSRGRFLSAWERPADALGDLHRSLGFRAAGEQEDHARAFEAIGSAHLRLSQPLQALSFLRRAASVAPSGSALLGLTLQSLGLAHQALGDSGSALVHYRKAIRLYARRHDAEGIRRSRLALARGLVEARRHEAAQRLFERLLDGARPADDPELWAAVNYELARLHYRSGRLPQARTCAMLAIEAYESWPYQVGSLNLRTAYRAKRQPFYELAIEILAASEGESTEGRFLREALETSDRARSQALRDLILSGDARHAEPSSAATRQRELTAKIRSVREQRAKAADRRPFDDELAGLMRDLDVVSRRLRLEPPPDAQPRVETIQELLDDESAVLQFHLGRERSRLFVVTHRSVRVHYLVDRTTIERELAIAWERLSSAIAVTAETEAALERVSRSLLAPLGADLPARRLIVVGDGALLGFPFGVLSLSGSSPYRPLLAEHEVITVPSLGVLTALVGRRASRGPAPRDMVVFADPDYADQQAFPALTHTRREAAALDRLRGDRVLVARFGENATREALSGMDLARFGLIHLATHGEFDPVQPLLSRLAFAGKGESDAPLFAYEVYDLPITADLVVLSGCETGKGAFVPGEGVLGLSHAFLAAGADRVLVTLRPVEDGPTADLFEDFYAALLGRHASPEAALRQVQVERWRRGERFERWAPFVLVGRPGS